MTRNTTIHAVGILGGGQLGLYLCRAAQELGLKTHVVAPDQAAPALAIADEAIVASLEDPRAAEKLIRTCDVVTFEIESIGDEVLNVLTQYASAGDILVAPDPSILRMVQNKATQKAWLKRNGFRTSDYIIVDNPSAEAARIASHFGFPFVQKVQRGGYDGRGVQIIRHARDLASLFPVASVIEAFVPIKHELGVVLARGYDGEKQCFATVAMEFDGEHNILERVLSPAPVEEALRSHAQQFAQEIIDRCRGVGVFAVEFFATDEELLVNEISPRVHNTGHLTLDACAYSQFEQHLRAIAKLPLGSTTQRAPAVMHNILASPAYANICAVDPSRFANTPADSYIYWYGKRAATPWRKMGHITTVGTTIEQATTRADDALKYVRDLCREAEPS